MRVAVPERLITPLTQVDVIKAILPFLTQKDIMTVRMLNFEWNYVVNTMCPEFKLHVKIRESWYNEAESDWGINMESKTKWNSATMSHFKFHRNSSIFKAYWQNTAALLKTLTIFHCSLECDGFKFILENCPVLTNLTLDTCRFRDTTDCYAKVPSGGFSVESKGIEHDIRHLKFLRISIMDVCHLSYLVERCGKLESLLIQECFHPPPKIVVKEYNENNLKQKELVTETQRDEFTPEEFERIYQDFEFKLVDLLAANRLTKFEFIRNNFDFCFLTKIISTLGVLFINDFTWEMYPPANTQSSLAALVEFLAKCVGLQALRLVFHEDVTNQYLESLLWNVRHTVQKLEMLFEGNKLQAPLDLNFLQDFNKLTRLEIQDTKGLPQKIICRLIGGQRDEANRGTNSNTIILANETRINSDFMSHLPPNLEELQLDNYITSNDPLIIDLMHPIRDSLRRLSKLEIHGPWIHSMSNLIPFISTHLEHLNTLALTACGLDDKKMTGLDEEGVTNMYRNLSNAFFALRENPKSTAEEISESVCGKMIFPPASGPRLSNLKKLKHLDLSFNSNISNLTLFYGLRIHSLKTLNLYGSSRISDLGMYFIALYNPGLETLNVKNCRKLSKYGLNAAVKGCKRLKTLVSTKAADLRTPREAVIDPTATISQNYADIVDVSRSEMLGTSS